MTISKMWCMGPKGSVGTVGYELVESLADIGRGVGSGYNSLAKWTSISQGCVF